MIKYFCDKCKEEIPKNDPIFDLSICNQNEKKEKGDVYFTICLDCKVEIQGELV